MNLNLSVRASSGLNFPVGSWDWFSPPRGYFNLWVSYSGTGVLTVGEDRYEVSPGFALLLHPEDTARGQKPVDVPFCNIALHFDLDTNREASASLSRFRQKPTRLRHLAVVYEMMKYMDYLLERGEQAQAECDTLGAQILRVFVRDWELGPEDPVDERIREQSEVLRNHPERVWALAELSGGVGLSISQFSRRFTKLFGISPNAFLIQARVAKARGLLRESTLSVSEIADILGYADVAFFSRQFKRVTGVSPKAFRRDAYHRA